MFTAMLAAVVHVAHAAECTKEMVTTADSVISQNKAVFQSCLTDLKSASGAATTSFIATEYTSADRANTICASDNCVKALIAAMENLPDCCSSVGSSGVTVVTNLPRLADDILYQCDVRDAALLSAELEKEIEKLPDLKVQIKSVKAANGSSSGNSTDVDVIIDVKKRELMKDGASLGNSTDATKDGDETTSGATTTGMVRASQAVLVAAVLASVLA